MKKVMSILLLILMIGGLIFLDGYFIIRPGINKYKNAKKIIVLSENQVNSKKEEIIKKYNDLQVKLDEKYSKLKSDLETEYNNKNAALTQKYKDLEAQVDAKYTKQMGDAGWFDEQSKKSDEKSELSEKEANEDGSLFDEKNDKIISLDMQKVREQETLQTKKENELGSITTNRIIKVIKEIIAFVYIIGGSLLIILIISINVKMINKLIELKNNVKKSWSGVDILLKQRYDMIPNIVSVVKGYSKYEKGTLENITKLRASINDDHSQNNIIKANYKLNEDIKKILLLKEAYPELKSNGNYMKLQDELSVMEDKIANARTEYNNAVVSYQNKVLSIPSNLWAIILNYKEEPYFGIKDTEKENVNVNI